MASQVSHTAADGSSHIYQISDAIPIHLTDHPPPPVSPPITVKEMGSVFARSPSQHHDGQGTFRLYSFNPLAPLQVVPRVGVRLFFVLVALLALFCWWRSGSDQDFEALKHKSSTSTKSMLQSTLLDGFHFTPANNQHIHYVGRWIHTPDQLRRDSSFPSEKHLLNDLPRPSNLTSGAYLEFVVRNCSSVYASLRNTNLLSTAQTIVGDRDASEIKRLNFRPLPKEITTAPPVSLVSRIDISHYTYFHQSGKGLMAITSTTLNTSEDHIIRIIAPGIDDGGRGGVEFEGVWLNKGASLASLPGTKRSARPAMDSNAPPVQAQESLPYSLQGLEIQEVKEFTGSDPVASGLQQFAWAPQKTLEIVTDRPGTSRVHAGNGSLTALPGWEELVGEMFGADHVNIALSNMCLTYLCIGSSSQAASVEDAFFRSGSLGSSSFARSWNFQSYIPDTLVLVLGSSDEASFRMHGSVYEKTLRDLRRKFEDTYVRFVRSIRRAAYPLHPAALYDYSSNADGFVYNSAPATIPIFVVSPFTGEMSHSTQRVVERLQSEGDKAVIWLDTSGWFSPGDFEPNMDSRLSNGRAQSLNTLGNQKAAVFLHAHLCHYLAEDQAQCPFLRHEAYRGKVYVPKDAALDKMIEESKTRKLKALFWPAEED